MGNVGGFVASCQRQLLHEWKNVCVTGLCSWTVGLRVELDVLRCNECLASWVDDWMDGWLNTWMVGWTGMSAFSVAVQLA